MINAQELMLSNWLIDAKRNRFVQMGGLEPSQNAIWVNYANGSGLYKIDINDISPIPLSPDLLEKCGFIEDVIPKGSGIFTHNKFDLTVFTKPTDLIAAPYVNWQPRMITTIPYLHQLQNLFYCLTGQPLNISL